MSYIILALVIYILYRFIFGFVLPILSVSRKMNEKMRDVHGNMNGFNQTTEANGNSTGYTGTKKDDSSKPSSKDYIEFEEIK